MKKRIIYDIFLLGALCYTPWWALVILVFIGAYLWVPFYEVIFLGLLADLLYGATMSWGGGFLGVGAAFLVFAAALYARKVLR